MNQIKDISLFIIIAILMRFLTNSLESQFLFNYLTENIIGLLLTLLAINTATLGLIASKIQDIIVTYPNFSFADTIKEMKISLIEQIVLIVISIFTLTIANSCKIEFTEKINICATILLTVFIYAINILWDTGKAVFVVIEELQRMRRDNEN